MRMNLKRQFQYASITSRMLLEAARRMEKLCKDPDSRLAQDAEKVRIIGARMAKTVGE